MRALNSFDIEVFMLTRQAISHAFMAAILLCGTSVVLAAPDQIANTIVRLPVPDARSLGNASKIIAEVYAQDLKDTAPKAREALIWRLLNDATQVKNDSAGLYAMLQKARELSIAAANVQTMIDASEERGRLFSGDPLPAEIDAVRQIEPKVQTPEAQALLARYGLQLLSRLLNAERYAEIAPVIEAVEQAEAGLNNVTISNRVKDRLAYIQFVAAERERLKPAFDALASNPDDAEANAAVGRFYCAFWGDWKTGLALLAKGSAKGRDAAELKALAVSDIASPTGATDQVALADAWWELAQKQTDLTKTRIETRSAFWYRRALPKIDGLVKALAVKRINTIAQSDEKLAPAARQVVDLLKLVDLGRGVIKGKWYVTDGALVGECRDLGLLRFPYVPRDEYDFSCEIASNNAEWLAGMVASKGGVPFQWVPGATKGGKAHLDALSPELAAKTESDFLMAEGRRHVFRMEVRDSGIKVYADDELVCSYHTDYHDFQIPAAGGELAALGVSGWWKTLTIYRAEVTEYGRPGVVPRGQGDGKR